MKRPRGKPASIRYSRWAAYATTGAATTLACASSAEAEIHYSGLINHDFANGGFAGPLDSRVAPGILLELNIGTGSQIGNNTWAFGIANIRSVPQRRAFGAFAGTVASYAGIYVSELPAGQSLRAQHFAFSCTWSSSCSCQVCYYGALIGGSGKFREGGYGFIGFVFSQNGQGSQHGWARIQKSGPPYYRFRLLDYAWADPGDTIKTGQRSSLGKTVDVVPESGSIGLLALGAAGLLAWRQRRRQATK